MSEIVFEEALVAIAYSSPKQKSTNAKLVADIIDAFAADNYNLDLQTDKSVDEIELIDPDSGLVISLGSTTIKALVRGGEQRLFLSKAPLRLRKIVKTLLNLPLLEQDLRSMQYSASAIFIPTNDQKQSDAVMANIGNSFFTTSKERLKSFTVGYEVEADDGQIILNQFEAVKNRRSSLRAVRVLVSHLKRSEEREELLDFLEKINLIAELQNATQQLEKNK